MPRHQHFHLVRDSHEPILGYRAWWARKIKDPMTGLWDVFLTSLTFDGVIWDGPVMRAEGLRPIDLTYHGPGVYSYRQIEDAYHRLDASVFGEIEYSGLVGRYRLGYRGEAAVIRRLFVYPGRWSKTLAERTRAIKPTNNWADIRKFEEEAATSHGATFYIQKKPPFTIKRHDEDLCRVLELKYFCDVERLPITDYLSHFDMNRRAK